MIPSNSKHKLEVGKEQLQVYAPGYAPKGTQTALPGPRYRINLFVARVSSLFQVTISWVPVIFGCDENIGRTRAGRKSFKRETKQVVTVRDGVVVVHRLPPHHHLSNKMSTEWCRVPTCPRVL
jgi:hypothetical protein